VQDARSVGHTIPCPSDTVAHQNRSYFDCFDSANSTICHHAGTPQTFVDTLGRLRRLLRELPAGQPSRAGHGRQGGQFRDAPVVSAEQGSQLEVEIETGRRVEIGTRCRVEMDGRKPAQRQVSMLQNFFVRNLLNFRTKLECLIE
jgi:hypothetical protein